MKQYDWLEGFDYNYESEEDEPQTEDNNSTENSDVENEPDGAEAQGLSTNKKNDKKKSAGEKVSDVAQKAKDAKEIGTKVGKLSKTLGPIMPVLGYIAIIVAVLIAAIGLLMFLLTMPGAILDKIKSIAADFGNALINLVVGEANNVKQSQISDVATRLEDMGYDMYAYGFESDKVKPEAGSNFWGSTVYHTEFLNHEVKTHDFFDTDYKPDMDTLRVTDDGILRDKNGVVYIESDYIRAYLVSDNYVYMIRNNNFNLINAFKSIAELKFFRTLFSGNFGDGLINLYHEGSGLGTLGDNFGVLDSVGGFLRALFGGSRISISIDRPAKQLVVSTEVNGFYGVKRKFLYNLDGWTGRYGMPLEFLLSLHLSSMQPDLAYDLVTKTETELQLVAHKSEATVKGGIKIEENQYKIPAEILGEEYVVPSGIYDTEQLQKLKETIMKLLEQAYFSATTEEQLTKIEDMAELVADTLDGLIAKAGQLNTKFDTFIPYIYAVRCHWFRDVYFTDNAGVDKFIEIDEDYEVRTAQRWTKYETVKASETGANTEDLDNTITYGDGSDKYVAERSEYTRGGLGDVQYILYYYKDGKLDNETVYMYNGKYGTREDADKDTSLTQDEKNSLHKKAITSTLDWKYYEDVKNDEDYDGKVSGLSDRWVAYKEIENQDSGWQKYVPDNSGGQHDNISTEEAKNLYYKIILSSAISQIEDGQRGATNALTKQIFSINKYYTYNGTAERAADIDNDRYSSNIKDEYEKYKDGDTNTSFNTENDKRNKDLIETFSVTRDSISAFNILTNMNTLDSDAIYHDFKELIVELNFFDKEELTALPNESFEWPIPEIGNRGWPEREYSKYENEYGTSIHSKYLLKFFKQKDMIGMSFDSEATEEGELEDEWGGYDEEVLADHDHLHTITEIVKTQAQDTEFGAPFEELEYSGSEDLTKVSGGPEVTPEMLTVDEYLQTTEEMCNYINATGYDYCVNRPASKCEGKNGTHCTPDCMALAALPPPLGIRACTGADCLCEVNHCNHTPHLNKCQLPNSFAASKQSPTTKQNMCCATLVSWSLINMKMMKPSDCQHGPKGVADYCLKVLGAEKIEPGEDLQPGDILIYERHSHTDILGEPIDGGFKKYNGGHYVLPGAEPLGQHSSINLQPGDGWTSKSGQIVIYACRLPWGNKNNTDQYKGYKGGELVVSPVTGIVIQAGTKQKITNIETGLKEVVGYAKIRVLNRTDFTAAFGKDGSSDEELEGFKYFLEEYEDNKVAGDIMYIEGFSLELLNDSLGITSNSNVINSKGEPINLYTQQEYKYVLNKNIRKKLEDKEKARVKAKPIYQSSAGLLIKEGTALGTTYSDGDYEIKYQEYLNELREEAGEDTWTVVGKEPMTADDPRNGRTITERPGLTGADGSENLYDHEEILKYKGDGNFIRMIMRASKDGFDAKVEKDSIIEDVEDYIELTPRPPHEIDWELFFWTPHESGPADMNGPICYEDHPGSTCVTAGMIQWMTAYDNGGNHNIQYLCEHLVEHDSEIGNKLSFISKWTNEQIKDDVKGARELEKAFSSVNNKRHDDLMWAELEVAKVQYLEPLLKEHPWLEKRPHCVQGAIMHIAVHDGHYPSDLDSWESLDDFGVLDKVAAHWNDGSWEFKEPGIARAIIEKKLTTDDVEYWVRNKDVQFLIEHGVDYYGNGAN